MSKMSPRIMLALLVVVITVLISRPDFRGCSGAVFAQTSAASPSTQASPVTSPDRVPKVDHPHPGFLWVKGHPLLMPYSECGNLIERAIWGQQVTITDEPCKTKLAEALRINRTEPDVDAAPVLNGSRPEDLSPPGTQPPARRAEPTQ